MDSYKVIVEPATEKKLAAINALAIRKKVEAKIVKLAAGPHRLPGCIKLTGRRGQPAYRIRQNDYRIVFTVDKKAREVHVVRVDARDKVYKTNGGGF